jgi:hypothetical protein
MTSTIIFTIIITILSIIVITLLLITFHTYGVVAELTQKMQQQFLLNDFIVKKLEELDINSKVNYWGPKGEA